MITNLKINPKQKALYYEKGYWTNQTLNDIWIEQAKGNPQAEYISDDQGLRLTYQAVDDQASRLASWFVEQGIQAGDVVSFQIPNWAEFAVVYVACLKVGAVMHPLSRTFNEKDLAYDMGKAGTKVFICPTISRKINYETQIQNIAPSIPSLQSIALLDKQAPATSKLITVSQIVQNYKPIKTKPNISADDVACILTTSGTTGKSKEALLTHNNIIFSERSFVAGLKRTKNDVMFMPSPLNHATGFFHGIIAPMILGGRTVLQQEFNAKDTVSLVNTEKATWSMGATPFIYDILKYLEQNENTRIETLKLYLCGGAPVPSSLVQRAWKNGILLCEIYGSTESCPHIYVPPEHCLNWNGEWSGIPFEGIEVRVVDENHNEVPFGTRGEEASRGPHQFVGYLNEPERTARALDNEGWFYSGDLCFQNEESRIRISGRKKEIIIRGGENICSQEVDEHLSDCPSIGQHATIGMPDERLGERICTFAVSSDGVFPTISEITAHLAEKGVPKRLWPERIEYIDAIPITSSGKVRRFLLAEELARRIKKSSSVL